VIPQFNGTSGSTLVLTNLSTEFVTADVRFYSANGAVLTNTSVALLPGLQKRLASTSFRTGEGTLVIQSSATLSVSAAIATTNGFYENVAPAPEAVNIVVPFSFANAAKTDLTIANAYQLPTKALIRSFGADGTPLNTVERSIPAYSSVTEAVSTMFPQSMSASGTPIASIGILAEANVLTEERRLSVQARIRDYADPALLTASTITPTSTNPVLPFFVQGGGYVTTIQVMNPSTTSATVSMQAFDAEGRLLSSPAPLQLAPNASIRNDAPTLLRLPAGSASGSIVFNSNGPVLITEAIVTTTRSGIVVTSGVEAATSFAFSQRKPPLRAAVAMTLANHNSTPARVKLRSITADGVTVAQVAVTLKAFASVSHSFAEFFADDQIDGIVHVTSDVPVSASALEINSDSSLIANLPGMASQPGYAPPNPSLFRITGIVRRISGVVPGIKVQITDSINLSTLSDTNGKYTLRVIPGQYGIEASDPSYVFNPPGRTVEIIDADSIANDFEGALIGPSPKPTLVSISPATTDLRLDPEAAPLVLDITGSEFRPGARVMFGKTPLSTQFNSPTSLTALIPASLLLSGGSFEVSVDNPSPNLGASKTLLLLVRNAAPALGSVEPESPVLEPGLPLSITLHGENFAPNSVFEVTPPCAAIYVTNRIDPQTALLSVNAQCTGSYYVRVKTPEPGGGTTQTLAVTVK